MLRVGGALRFTGFTGVSVGYDVVCWFTISVCLHYNVWTMEALLRARS